MGICESWADLVEKFDIAARTTNRRTAAGYVIETQLPSNIDGAARVFTIRTDIPYEGISRTSAYMDDRAGVYNPSNDIPRFRAEAIEPLRAWIHHRFMLTELYENVGYQPTETFENHCTRNDHSTNNP